MTMGERVLALGKVLREVGVGFTVYATEAKLEVTFEDGARMTLRPTRYVAAGVCGRCGRNVKGGDLCDRCEAEVK